MSNGASQSTAEAGGLKGAVSYVKESIEELKKVQRPTRQQTIQATLVTLAIMIFISVVLSLFDFLFRWLVGQFV